MDPSIQSVLTRSGTIAFSSNLPFVKNLQVVGGRVVRQPSGHLVFYGAHNRRFLATDPDGNPLHECEWVSEGGGFVLSRARIHLDWGGWIGLKPGGLVNSTVMDLRTRPDWQRIRPDDLRQMAAQAMGVPLEEVHFFYGDEDLIIDKRGQATIHHRKDALYVLDDGTFEKARFMACLGAMHWDRIDFLPVVELFQSLLPGTGSAMFELIRGLYDDQNEKGPLPLRYRGIPTYPSEAAFRLFSGFFQPRVAGGGDLFSIFMDVPRSHEVTWLPIPNPPRRYFDQARRLCVTVTGERIQKVTLADDPAGLSFVAPGPNGFAACEHGVVVNQGNVILIDREERAEMPVNPAWGLLQDSPVSSLMPQAMGWRELFGGPPPDVKPAQAFSAVLLYPDDDREIEEVPTQPFVVDYIQDMMDQRPELAASLSKADRILIHSFDAGVASCIHVDRPRDYTILYHRPEFAQRQAQVLWSPLAQTQRLACARGIEFLPAETYVKAAYEQQYDLIYRWVPFSHFDNPTKLAEALGSLVTALKPGGLAFVAGPATLERILRTQGIRLLRTDLVETLPTFRMHQTILPKARIKPGLTLYQVAKV